MESTDGDQEAREFCKSALVSPKKVNKENRDRVAMLVRSPHLEQREQLLGIPELKSGTGMNKKERNFQFIEVIFQERIKQKPFTIWLEIGDVYRTSLVPVLTQQPLILVTNQEPLPSLKSGLVIHFSNSSVKDT